MKSRTLQLTHEQIEDIVKALRIAQGKASEAQAACFLINQPQAADLAWAKHIDFSNLASGIAEGLFDA